MSDSPARILASIARYQLRFGEFPLVWFISLDDQKALNTAAGSLGNVASIVHGGGVRTILRVRNLVKVFGEVAAK